MAKRKTKFDRCVEGVARSGSAYDPRAVCGAMEKRLRGNGSRRKVEKRVGKALRKYVDGQKVKRNPEEAAVKAYEDFHGRAPGEEAVVERDVHVHRHLSGAGELRKLVILAADGESIVTLTRFKGAVLAFNERRNQLFIEGGDQAVDLSDFGIDPAEAHELETLGRVKSLDYHTVKDHLGDEGGEAIYRHQFRTTNENGRHVTIRIARYPDAIYRVLDEHIEFSGGSYEIIAEGIDR